MEEVKKDENGYEKITYREFYKRMCDYNSENEVTTKGGNSKYLKGVIVITEGSFTEHYSEEARSYFVTSDNKAFISGMGGYSIYGSSLDGTDNGVRLEAYLKEEKGGANGWEVEYCYILGEGEYKGYGD